MNTQDEQVLSSLVKDYEDVNEQLERLAEKKSGLRRIILDMLRRIHGDDEVDWTDGNYILNRDFRHSEIIDLDILQDLLQPQQYLDITDEERKINPEKLRMELAKGTIGMESVQLAILSSIVEVLKVRRVEKNDILDVK